jgi:hypothetical protein
VLQSGVLPLAVRLQHRRVLDTELLGEIVGNLRRDVRWVVQEHAQIAHDRQLCREAEPVVGPALGLDQLPVRVVQEEEPLQLRTGRCPVVRRVPRGLLIRQKLDRHPGTSRQSVINTTAEGSAPVEAQVKALPRAWRA